MAQQEKELDMCKVTTDRFLAHDDRCELVAAGPGQECQCPVREVGWIAQEARALMTIATPAEESPERPWWQARWDAFTARKIALMAYIEATRGE